MNLQVDIQKACEEPAPEEEDIRGWIEAALQGQCDEAEVSVRLVDESEMSALNNQYRGQQKATNVLAFPVQLPAGVMHPMLGDIVVCAAVVDREATEQGKSATAHWAHMFVHGSLHLLGYDHVDNRDAEIMERLETAILKTLNYACPYGSESGPRRIQGGHRQ